MIQLGLFDEKDLVELESADYPGERLIACRNPLVAASNQAKREALLAETEKELEAIVAATQREKRALRGADKIGVRVGKILNKFKVGKFFDYEIGDESFSYSRKREAIAEAEALDGIYIVRTSVAEKMLAYYVEWHMRKALAPILFNDEAMVEEAPEAVSIVAKAQKSKKAKSKANKKRTDEKLPVHSLATLLQDLATITSNKIKSHLAGANLIIEKITQPTPVQQKAFDLLDVSLMCTQ